MEHKDLFSGHAKLYSVFRPTYPVELYDFIFKHVNQFDNAWDCGTGNGQVASVLAQHFNHVDATDLSSKQLEQAPALLNVTYTTTPAEQTSLPNQHFDLITVAQALHWIELEKFYAEVKRVAKPGALLAVWGYSVLSINEEMDSHLLHFYKDIVGPYWDQARRLVDEEYKTVSFPFEEIQSQQFYIKVEWDLAHLAGYLETWSSTQKYISVHGKNPVTELIGIFKKYWGDETKARTISFPIFLRLGRL